jgi:hypothetical protein
MFAETIEYMDVNRSDNAHRDVLQKGSFAMDALFWLTNDDLGFLGNAIVQMY